MTIPCIYCRQLYASDSCSLRNKKVLFLFLHQLSNYGKLVYIRIGGTEYYKYINIWYTEHVALNETTMLINMKKSKSCVLGCVWMCVKCLQQKQVQVNLRRLHVQLPLEKKSWNVTSVPRRFHFCQKFLSVSMLFWEFVYFEMMFRLGLLA